MFRQIIFGFALWQVSLRPNGGGRLTSKRDNEKEVRDLKRQIVILKKELEKERIHDAKTGLLNDRGLRRELEREISRLAREGGGITVFFLDVKHLQEVNNRLGHDYGDWLIHRAVEQIRARAYDIVARVGGDEFVVVMINADTTHGFVKSLRPLVYVGDYQASWAGGTHLTAGEAKSRCDYALCEANRTMRRRKQASKRRRSAHLEQLGPSLRKQYQRRWLDHLRRELDDFRSTARIPSWR